MVICRECGNAIGDIPNPAPGSSNGHKSNCSRNPNRRTVQERFGRMPISLTDAKLDKIIELLEKLLEKGTQGG